MLGKSPTFPNFDRFIEADDHFFLQKMQYIGMHSPFSKLTQEPFFGQSRKSQGCTKPPLDEPSRPKMAQVTIAGSGKPLAVKHHWVMMKTLGCKTIPLGCKRC